MTEYPRAAVTFSANSPSALDCEQHAIEAEHKNTYLDAAAWWLAAQFKASNESDCQRYRMRELAAVERATTDERGNAVFSLGGAIRSGSRRVSERR